MTNGDDTPVPAPGRPPSTGWPPPHPSPPLPAPREYGVPGTATSRTPYVVGAVAVVVVLALVVGVVLWLTGGGDDQTATEQPTPTESSQSSATPESAPAGVTCWDGASATALEECTEPAGAAGLTWVFPALADARCGKASAQGGDGVVTRVLCIYRLADGSKAQLGAFAWASVEQGTAFYDDQGLTRADGDVTTWSGPAGSGTKTAAMYADAPYSLTITSSGPLSADDQAALAPRPVAELRGTPAS